MPECPEIYIMSLYLKECVMDKKIKSISVFDKENPKMKKIKTRLIDNNTVNNIRTKGKLLWFELSNNIYITCSFGLEGYWAYNEEAPYIKLTITLDDDTKLYYCDKLNYGTIEILNEENLLDEKLNKLSPDILQTEMTDSELKNIIIEYIKKLKNREKNIVKVLMEQNNIVSGIGNYLVAEILYCAKINPHRSITDLSSNEIQHLAHCMRKIVKNSYYHHNNRYTKHYNYFMQSFQQKINDKKYNEFHNDVKILKNFTLQVYRQKSDRKGNIVITDKIIAGRTTYWCPAVQI